MPPGTEEAFSRKRLYEINHHRALGKQKFSLKYSAGLETELGEIIQPVTDNPDDSVLTEYNRTFRSVESGYFVINKKFF